MQSRYACHMYAPSEPYSSSSLLGKSESTVSFISAAFGSSAMQRQRAAGGGLRRRVGAVALGGGPRY